MKIKDIQDKVLEAIMEAMGDKRSGKKPMAVEVEIASHSPMMDGEEMAMGGSKEDETMDEIGLGDYMKKRKRVMKY